MQAFHADRVTNLVYPVLGHGCDGDDLDANQTGVTHGVTVWITRPIKRVDVPGPLRDLTHHSVPLQQGREVMAVAGAHLQSSVERSTRVTKRQSPDDILYGQLASGKEGQTQRDATSSASKTS